MEEELKIPIHDPAAEIHYPAAETIAKIIIDTPEDSVGVIIVKERKHMDIIAEALTMYAFLEDMQAPIHEDLVSSNWLRCAWCGKGNGATTPIEHAEDCRWTASRQILERIEKVD